MNLRNKSKEEPPKKKEKKLSNRITYNNKNNTNISSYDNISKGILPVKSINNNFVFNVHLMKQRKDKKYLNKKKPVKLKIKTIYGDNTKEPLENKINNKKSRESNSNIIQEQNNKNLNDYEMNNLEYEMAIKYDKRTYFQYYWSLLKKKQLILFTFLPNNDYNITYIKIILFIISFSLFFTINLILYIKFHKYFILQ